MIAGCTSKTDRVAPRSSLGASPYTGDWEDLTMAHNRLKLMRFYLVGPMDYDRDSGREWREDIGEWLISRKALPMDPYNKPMLDLHADGLEDDDNYEARKIAIASGDFAEARRLTKPVVSADLRMVDESSALICNLDLDKRPCGTWDETFMSAGQNKPIIIHCPQGVKNLPHWLFGRLNHECFFDTWPDVKKYLAHIDTDDNIDTLNRWKFFDLEPLIRRVLNL